MYIFFGYETKIIQSESYRHHINITINDTHCILEQLMVDTVIRMVNDIRYESIFIII